MLSKLLFALHPVPSVDAGKIWACLKAHMADKYAARAQQNTEASWGGTLGVLSSWTIGAEKIVAKTHLPDDMCRSNIEKEYAILRSLYGQELFIDKVELEVEDKKFSVLLMEHLAPVEREILPRDVKNLVDSIQRTIFTVERLKSFYRAKDLAIYTRKASAELSGAGLLDEDFAAVFREAEQDLADILDEPSVLVHGDLSNPNILRKGERLYLLDWEDAFLCTRDYDFLYWLTFFSQEKFLTAAQFETMGILNRRSEILMMTIVLLKSYIAFLTGAYKTHRVSVNERLERIRRIFA